MHNIRHRASARQRDELHCLPWSDPWVPGSRDPRTQDPGPRTWTLGPEGSGCLLRGLHPDYSRSRGTYRSSPVHLFFLLFLIPLFLRKIIPNDPPNGAQIPQKSQKIYPKSVIDKDINKYDEQIENSRPWNLQNH